MESIVRYIERHFESLTAVLILAVEYFYIEYTYSIWSAILPKTLVNHIAFIFPSSLSLAWSVMVPEALKMFRVFTVDSPNGGMRVWSSLEPTAMKSLVALFDWLDDLEPQPVKEIVSLYQKYQSIEAKTFTILHQKPREIEIDTLMTKLKGHSAVSLSPYLHLAFGSYSRWR